MEILSEPFRRAVILALESQVTVPGAIVSRSTPFPDAIKARSEVRVIAVRPDNQVAKMVLQEPGLSDELPVE